MKNEVFDWRYFAAIGGLTITALIGGNSLTYDRSVDLTLESMRDCSKNTKLEIIVNRKTISPVVILLENEDGLARFITPITNQKTGEYSIKLQSSTLSLSDNKILDLADKRPLLITAYHDFIEAKVQVTPATTFAEQNNLLGDASLYDGGFESHNPYELEEVKAKLLSSEVLARKQAVCNF